jgi:sec-independent protein translocase protein TatA
MTPPNALFLALPGPTELWVVALIVVLLFGARKLPELARAAGSSISMFKRGLKEDNELEEGQTRRDSPGGTPAASEAKDRK